VNDLQDSDDFTICPQHNDTLHTDNRGKRVKRVTDEKKGGATNKTESRRKKPKQKDRNIISKYDVDFPIDR
jgi:hypothetical protein